MTVDVQPINPDLFTVTKYKIGNKYKEERAALHEEILFVRLNKEKTSKNKAILLGGGSGAGKTTIVEEKFLKSKIELSDYIYIDSDDIKQDLPEYIQYRENEDTVYWAAFYVHEESTDVMEQLIDSCIEQRLSFIYDGTMSWLPHYEELLAKLKSAEYHTLGMYVDVDPDIALKRTEKRAAINKRFVPPKKVLEANRNSAINFRLLEFKFDEVLMFNNNREDVEVSDIEAFYIRSSNSTSTIPFSDGEILNEEYFSLFFEKSNLPYI